MNCTHEPTLHKSILRKGEMPFGPQLFHWKKSNPYVGLIQINNPSMWNEPSSKYFLTSLAILESPGQLEPFSIVSYQ